jgi:hypothetical protein
MLVPKGIPLALGQEIRMPDYRIYLISEGHIKAGYDFTFETDDEARLQARSMLGMYTGAEVWIGTTLVSTEVSNPTSEADCPQADSGSCAAV